MINMLRNTIYTVILFSWVDIILFAAGKEGFFFCLESISLLMGGKSSKGSRGRDYSSYGSANSSSSWNQYGYPPASSYPSPQHDPYWTQQHHHAPAPNPSYPYESQMPPQQPHKRLDRKYSRIADNYQTLDQVGWTINLFNYS